MNREVTGRTRYRVKTRFLRSPLIVLQLEETISWPSGYDPYDGGSTQAGSRTGWRDARLEDLSIGAGDVQTNLAT